MNTAIDRINALAEVVPNDVIEFLNAQLCVRDTMERVHTAYVNAFASDVDIEGQDVYCTDRCGQNLGELNDKLWDRACTALENWIYKNYYN